MINILTTGGTIEGLDYESSQSPLDTPVSIEKLLADIKDIPKYSIKRLFSKDSRFITDNDRKLLIQEIHNSPSNQILITHGTYSMVETAQYVAQFELNRTIIFTGAFILGDKPNTDAKFNLYYAISQFKKVSSGVFIAIHNETFHWDNVVKNESKNRFERVTKW